LDSRAAVEDQCRVPAGTTALDEPASALGQADEESARGFEVTPRVYSPTQTPFERVLGSGRADVRRLAELKKLRSTLDPFALAQTIDRKLDKIYALVNRRLSPKARRFARRLWKSRALEKSKTGLSNRAWKSRKRRGIPTFPQPPRRAFGYIFICLDSNAQSYIFKCLDAANREARQ
jgi:hypothetical protein